MDEIRALPSAAKDVTSRQAARCTFSQGRPIVLVEADAFCATFNGYIHAADCVFSDDLTYCLTF